MTTQITAGMVKDLREKTGAGMMDAKNALTEAGGDMDKAVEILRQKGAASAEKKSGRATAEGLIQAKLSADLKKGAIIEVNCETDFVARGEEFQTLTQQLVAQALDSKAETLEQLLAEKSQFESGKTVDEALKERIGVIKENMNIRRFTRYEVKGTGVVASYIHTGNKIGVLAQIEADSAAALEKPAFKQLAKDLTMHIASSAPEFLSREDIPSEVVEEEKRIEMGKEDLQSKPPEIREKIVAGRIDKLLAQRVLLEQPFVKDPGKSITELVKEVSNEVGAKVTVTRFVRYLLGEGIEKRQDNFAEEVMAQIKG